MKEPEELAFIGGGILLSSTLVFTLKSQANHLLPQIDNGIAELFKNDNERKQDQSEQGFGKNYQQASQKGWTTGTWGDE